MTRSNESNAMRPDADIEQAIDIHGNTVWRVCVLYFSQSTADAQDAFQDTMLKYSLSTTSFTDEEHRKAWLIRVATNVCKDMLKAAYRSNIPLDEERIGTLPAPTTGEESPGSVVREVLDAMRCLTDPPRTPVYLALYEGYTAPEIAEMLDAPVGTVYSWISRGKDQLREILL